MSRVDDALLLRDTIQRIVDDKLGKERPKSNYALVTGFNPDEGTVSVIFDGDDITVDIPAGSIYPSEIGQTVRVGGSSGVKVIEDVMGENLTEVKARAAQETADGKNTVNYGDTPPEGTDHKDGDIWFDEGNSNMPNVWKDGGWVSIEDLRVAAIEEAQNELRQDLDTVVENGVGTKTFYRPTQPTEAESSEGDLWFDTSEGGNNELHTYVNGAWVSAADARIAAIQQAQAELASDLNDVVENGLGTRTHYTPAQPAVADSKEGDLWFDTSTAGKNAIHVFTGGAWVSAADARLAELKDAQDQLSADVTTVQATANGKNSITRSTANPPAVYAGRVDDLWWKMSTLSSGGRVIAQYRWNGTAWLTETIDNAVIANLDAAKITTGYLAAARIQANTLNADTVLVNGSLGSIILRDGAITTPKIAVGAITAESGVVASLDAGKITVGTLAAARFAANTINADSILINGTLGSTILRDGAITTPKIAVGAITAESGVVASLDAGKITVGTLDVARLGANSITADKVLLAQGNEMNADPWFDSGSSSTVWYDTSAGDGSGILAEGAMPGRKFGMVLKPKPKQANMSMYAGRMRPGCRIPVEPGETYTAYAWVYSQSEITGLTNNSGNYSGVNLQIYTYDDANTTSESADGRRFAGSRNGTFPAGQWIRVGDTQFTVGPNTRSISPRLTLYFPGSAQPISGDVYVGQVSVRKVAGSTLIEPGAITTEKIATGAITAESGVIGSLDASKITVGKLSGARLEADAINGMQIIGATIATSTGFPRVQMDTTGLAIYKTSSSRSFFADAATGDLSIVGDFATDVEGRPRVQISNSDWTNIEVIDSNGNTQAANGSGIRIGTSTSDGMEVYHGAYTDSAGEIIGQTGMVAGPRRRAMVALAETGEIMIQSREVSGKINASFSVQGNDQSQMSAYSRSTVNLVASVIADRDGQAYLSSDTSAGVTKSQVVATNDYSALSFDTGRSNQQALFIDGNGAKFEVKNVRGLPVIHGSFSSGTLVANEPVGINVTFPAGVFNNDPSVTISPVTTAPGTTVLGTSVASVSKTGFTAYVTRTNTTSTRLSFIAVGF